MKTEKIIKLIVLLFANLIFCSSFGQVNPQDKYGELFREVQRNEIFKDQKKFVDCDPKIHPDSIVQAYVTQKGTISFNLKDFVGQHFDTIQNDTAAMLQHISYLWSDLTKQPGKLNVHSSLLTLPNPYIVPGGRFKEIYYWDSYFTMLGLQESGKVEMIENMVDNFEYLINTYGHIPNGNRSYYLSRSQPPFFALMVDLLAETKNDNAIYGKYLTALEKEYQYWMTGEKVVRLKKKGVLNRYWDTSNTPRPESYLHDVELYHQAKRDSGMFRDIRSAAESGWDFSTRWFEDGFAMGKIITTDLLPVDLNCLLYHLEATLGKANTYKKNEKKARHYQDLAEKRKKLIVRYFWNEKKGFFFDYNLKTKIQTSQYTLAGLFPLFFKLVEADQAEKVKKKIEENFLKDGGLVTTQVKGSGQQWDYPNGWAPLQWIGYKAFKNYQFDGLAKEIARRWTNLNCKVYFETGKMMEKYDVVDINRPGGGGEYEMQDGFGWTNGVFLKLWKELHDWN